MDNIKPRRRKKLVQGVGINDGNCQVYRQDLTSPNKICPFYRKWVDMLVRCYNEKFKAMHPSYMNCTVCEEWLLFSNFKAWMETQDWEGKDLDKDLIVPGNRVYSPDACVFVNQMVNKFVIDCLASRGEWPIGVYWAKHANKFLAYCNDPFSNKRKHLGYHDSPEEAHLAWLKCKREFSILLAEQQDNPRVAEALLKRY